MRLPTTPILAGAPMRAQRARRIAAAVDRLGPWLTRVVVDGRAYGGDVDFTADGRVLTFEAEFGDARRVLELGSFEGGMSLALAAKPGRQVVAVEGRAFNVAKAQLAAELTRAGNVRFLLADLETVPPAYFGCFDAVLCSGLLYHLPRPWELLDRLPAAAPGLLLATHYAATDRADTTVDGVRGHWYAEQGYADSLSGLSPRSFWMTIPAIVDRLRSAGYSRVDLVRDEPDINPNGPHVVIAARR